MKPIGFIRITATLIVCIVASLTCAPASHAQLIGCAPTGTSKCIADMPGPAPGEQFTELSSGIFTYSKTDLSLPGPLPIYVARVYRSSDKVGSNWNVRAFGVGTSLNYDIFLYSFSEAANGQFTDAEVVLPDGGMIKCLRSDGFPATDYVDAQFACNQQPTGAWFGSTLTYNSGNAGWDLKRPDGTSYHFGFNAPLQTITDRFNNEITITRGGPKASICSHAIPANLISTISSSNGRSVSFCYDDTGYAGAISKVTDNSTVGKLVTYTYSTNKTLKTVTQTAFNTHAKTTYDYNQTSPSGLGNITEIIANDACSGTNCSSPLQFFTFITYVSNALGTPVKSISSQLPGNGYQYSYTLNGGTYAQKVTVTLPDGATRTFVYDSAGYVTKDQRNVGINSVNAEYTVFTRGLQTIGTVGNATGTTEFVGEVQEQDQNQNTVRQTNYNYDNAGNALSMTVSPKPGAPDNASTDCCSTSATWNYTYTTFNRIASAVEPLAYNGTGTTYTYDDTPSAPKVTVTNPLGELTTFTYNPEGQPISVKDNIHNTNNMAYFSSGDIQSITDGNGKTTSYQTDADGRVISVTSPLNELTTYHYDALDDVTDVYVDPTPQDPNGLNLHTIYTYDLIGGLASYTTPQGNKTTITHSASLGQITVTDPPPGSATTVTNIDGQGGATDYTDKRGLKTLYTYDAFGRMFIVGFNSLSKAGYDSFQVIAGTGSTPDAYDALGRPTNIWMWNGLTLIGGPDFTYDSLDNVLSEKAFGSGGVEFNPVIYQYDANGRRTSMSPTLNGNALPTINYGYDCADDLVSMSNDGSTLPSCSPTNDVTNGDPSTQIDFVYLESGLMYSMLSNGVVTFDSFDADERVTTRDYFSFPDGVVYGDLTYQYDADERLIDKGGSFAAVNLPPGDSAAYSPTDQLSTFQLTGFGSFPTNPDAASNITSDPLSLLTYTWNSRNQLSAISGGVAESYDALGRRQGSSSSTANLSLLHDGSSLIASADSVSGGTWSFLPGGIAGSFTSGGVTTTWVPLLDTDGSNIGLVSAAQPDSGPATTITYDPSGVASVSGPANSFPFLYQGLEHEVSDPGQLDFEPSGNVYNPQLQRELSQVGPQGLSIPNGGFGDFGDHAGSRGQSGNSLEQTFSDLGTVASAFFGAESAGSPYGFLTIGGSDNPINIPISLFNDLFDLFGLFGGDSDPPPPPRQLKHGRHPIYPILGIRLIPGEQSAARGEPKQAPDFYTYTVNVGELVGITGHVTVDRYGHTYYGVGVEAGKSPALYSFSATGGYLVQRTPPTPLELKNFATGYSVDCSVGNGAYGADVSYTPQTLMTGTYAVSGGWFAPAQAGCAVTYSWQWN